MYDLEANFRIYKGQIEFHEFHYNKNFYFVDKIDTLDGENSNSPYELYLYAHRYDRSGDINSRVDLELPLCDIELSFEKVFNLDKKEVF